VEATKKAPYSVDENLYHTSYESGMLEDPMVAPLKEMFKMTVDPEDAPDKVLVSSLPPSLFCFLREKKCAFEEK